MIIKWYLGVDTCDLKWMTNDIEKRLFLHENHNVKYKFHYMISQIPWPFKICHVIGKILRSIIIQYFHEQFLLRKWIINVFIVWKERSAKVFFGFFINNSFRLDVRLWIVRILYIKFNDCRYSCINKAYYYYYHISLILPQKKKQKMMK